jgi:long-chain acyl-CoA synthetase
METINPILTALSARVTEAPNHTCFQVIESDNSVTQLSYSELVMQAKRYAENLKTIGIKKGHRVAIISEPHPLAMVALFGVYFAGAIPAPLDVSLPAASWRKLLANIDVAAVSVSPTVMDKLSLDIKADFPIINHFAGGELFDESSLTKVKQKNWVANFPDTALILTSSGTSGSPSAICLNYENILAAAEVTAKNSKHIGELHCFCPLPIHHIYPLMTGYLYPAFQKLTTTMVLKITRPQLKKGLLLSQPNVVIFVPPLLELFYRRINQLLSKQSKMARLLVRMLQKINLAVFKKFHLNLGKVFFLNLQESFGHRLKAIFCGGAPLPKKVIETLTAMGLPIYNGYGASELSGAVIFVKSPLSGWMNNELKPKGIFIDAPDENGIGEICYRGKQLMPGYFNNPDKTAKAIVDNVYHSGDLGYLNHDGLVITGRKIDMIVTQGGKNVVPNELEEAYAKIKNNCKDFCIFGMPVGDAQEVHAAVVIEDTNDIEAQQKITNLVGQIATDFPYHMMIKKLHFLTEIPKAGGFKIKRSQLADHVLKQETTEQKSKTTSPETATETKILAIWQQCFSMDDWQDDVLINFFELGGDSLLLSDIMARVAQEFGLKDTSDIPLSEFIKSPTPRQLAHLVDTAIENRPEEVLRAIEAAKQQRDRVKKQFHKSTAKQRFWGGCYQILLTILVPFFWFGCGAPFYFLGHQIYLNSNLLLLSIYIPLGFIGWLFLSLLFCILMKWLIIGKYKAGKHPIHGIYYYRWWTVNLFNRIILNNFNVILFGLQRTRLMTWVCRAMGARIGRGSEIYTTVDAADMLKIGENSIIETTSYITSAKLENGYLHIAPVTIGNYVKVNPGATVLANANVADYCAIGANQVHDEKNYQQTDPEKFVAKSTAFELAQWLYGLVFFPYLLLVLIFIAVTTINLFSWHFILKFPLYLMLSFLLLMSVTVLLKWTLLGKLKPKSYRKYGVYAFKKLIIKNLHAVIDMLLRLFVSTPLHKAWLKINGVKLDTSCAYAANFAPLGELLEIDKDVFISGNVTLDEVVEDEQYGFVRQEAIHFKDNSFALYSAVVKGGAVLEEAAGVSAQAVVESHQTVPAGFEMTNGNKLQRRTKDPIEYVRPSKQYSKHYDFWSHLRILFIFFCITLQVAVAFFFFQQFELLPLLILMPLLYLTIKIFYLFCFLIFKQKTVAADKTLWYASIQKRYRRTIPFEWLLSLYIIPDILGTPIYNLFLRLAGASVGKGVVCYGFVREADQLHIGKYASIGSQTLICGHMLIGSARGKYVIDAVHIGACASVGAKNLLLPHTEINNYAIIKTKAEPIFSCYF